MNSRDWGPENSMWEDIQDEAERRAVVDAEVIISDAHSAKEYIEDVAARKPYGEAKEA